MQAKPEAAQRRKRRLLVAASIVLIVAVVLAAAFFLYTGFYYHADDAAREVADGYAVRIEQEDGYITVAPREDAPRTGYVFYPGGKVEETAYLPYLAAVAQQGYYCVLLALPFRLAVLDMDGAAGPIARHPEISAWAVGGHSLGGVAAAGFAGENAPSVRGLVLLAAYPAADLSHSALAVVSVTATRDEVLDRDKYEAAKAQLPEDTAYVNIQGGNHGQFGMYGAQSGDGTATISPEEQRAQAAATTAELLAKL